jgi:predicted cobalt transporter CbtA
MVRNLLICGLIAGACGGLLATGFAELVGEPALDQAISFESAEDASAGAATMPAPVSRGVQRSVGLLTAVLVYGLAIGGLFALAFAAAYGRVGRASPAQTALWLAAAAFVVVFLVPFVKYPANPPSIGSPDTIGERTLLYFAMLATSLSSALTAVRLCSPLGRRLTAGATALLAAAAYFAIVVTAGLALPQIDEMPARFPATTLWNFRVASVGMQLVLWATLGLVFAATARRVMAGKPIWPR